MSNIESAMVLALEKMNECYGEIKKLEAGLAAAEAESRWIPCAERVPEYAQKSSLVAYADGAVGFAAWSVDYNDWILESLDTLAEHNAKTKFEKRVITHWRPLPSPPALAPATEKGSQPT